VSDPAAPDGPRARPVRPRDAASLVVLRGRGPATEVLLGRRARRHRFLPDVYVFPGGRLDAADRRAPATGAFDAASALAMGRRWPAAVARALAVAALRETREEAGLAFGRLEGGALVANLDGLSYLARAITPPESPIRYHARFFLADAERAVGDVADSHELLDLRFVPLADALSLPLVDVTEFLIGHLLRRAEGTAPAGIPFFHYRNGRPRIVYE